MKKEFSISIYLDKRSIKKDGKYPVKLRVYCTRSKRQKLLSTKFAFTIEEFEAVWLSPKPRKENKDLRLRLQGLENMSNKKAASISPFSIEQFEKEMNYKPDSGQKVYFHYKDYIEFLIKNDRLKTGKSYKYSEDKVKQFVETHKNRNYLELSFSDIDIHWLNEFEMYYSKSLSISSIGIVLRSLKAIFNKAISENKIDEKKYPFGNRKYKTPSAKGVKKSLNSKQLKTLFEAKPKSPQQEKAKDFWFLSYSMSGINIKDIAMLKYENMDGDTIKFYRAKTKFSSRTNLEKITVYLNYFSKSIIKKYGLSNQNHENYIFDIISESMSSDEKMRKIENFTRFINQHIKKLSQSIGLPEDISSYWARHSFATTSIRKGASMELMQESLGHKNIKTTQAYFDGFEDETRKELASKLMDF
ncbi:site-specific integrase [Winogradskyella sp.]|uniref:tyrosine-type recombinase/integrase n=1 Tax=Winogradskyella sp. TaxID=1883156 RepID=UPI002638EB3E|nr:site-specific integrase [Winogradskyella sp.]